jgi:hypothetical protein
MVFVKSSLRHKYEDRETVMKPAFDFMCDILKANA